MAEKLEENQFCENCGADVRLNALFCYNCGSQVATDEEVAAENQNGDNVSRAWFKETIAERNVPETSPVKKKKKPSITRDKDPEAIPKPIEKLTNSNLNRGIKPKPKPLPTAASIRNKTNPFLRKKFEVTWEKPENAPNIWFLIVSVILIGFALLILFAMLYIR
jgi:hypothetical protein